VTQHWSTEVESDLNSPQLVDTHKGQIPARRKSSAESERVLVAVAHTSERIATNERPRLYEADAVTLVTEAGVPEVLPTPVLALGLDDRLARIGSRSHRSRYQSQNQ
jgi:hypothetical protein